MTGGVTKYLAAVAVTAVSIALMGAGEAIFAAARLQSSSTFEIPSGRITLGIAMFFLSGVVFAAIFMVRATRDHHYGYLVPAAVALAVMVGVPLMWYAGAFGLFSWLRWIASPYIQGAASFALGGLIAHLIWRATGPKPFEEST